MHIMARHIQGNQALEDNGPPGPGGAQEDQETRGGATVRHHVQHGTEGGGLVEVSRGISIQGIQQARYTVQERTRSGMDGHIVKGGDGQNNPQIS